MKRFLLALGVVAVVGLTGIQTASAATCGLACSNTGHNSPTAPVIAAQPWHVKTRPAVAPRAHAKAGAKANVKQTTPRTGHVRGTIH
jgi:hypothetical protein